MAFCCFKLGIPHCWIKFGRWKGKRETRNWLTWLLQPIPQMRLLRRRNASKRDASSNHLIVFHHLQVTGGEKKCRGGEMPHDSYEPGKSGIRSSSICSNPAFPAAALSSSVFTGFRRVDFSIFLLASLSFRHWLRLRSMEWMGVEHGPPAVRPTICLGLGSYPSHGNLDELIINILIRGLFLCCD